MTVDEWPQPKLTDFRPELESGNVLYFPVTPFAFSEASQDFLRGLDFSGGAMHKNIAYRPASDRVTGVDGSNTRIQEVMRDYSRRVVQFTAELLPQYASAWRAGLCKFPAARGAKSRSAVEQAKRFAAYRCFPVAAHQRRFDSAGLHQHPPFENAQLGDDRSVSCTGGKVRTRCRPGKDS